MPRERFDDPTNPARFVQVNWRRRTDEADQGPQYVQVSTHHDGMSTVTRLIGWAIGIISNVDAPATGWPNQTEEWREAARQWLDTAASHHVECTGEYVQVGPGEIDQAIKVLHKAKRQAFGEKRETSEQAANRLLRGYLHQVEAGSNRDDELLIVRDALRYSRDDIVTMLTANSTGVPEAVVATAVERLDALPPQTWRVIGDDQVMAAENSGYVPETERSRQITEHIVDVFAPDADSRG